MTCIVVAAGYTTGDVSKQAQLSPFAVNHHVLTNDLCCGPPLSRHSHPATNSLDKLGVFASSAVRVSFQVREGLRRRRESSRLGYVFHVPDRRVVVRVRLLVCDGGLWSTSLVLASGGEIGDGWVGLVCHDARTIIECPETISTRSFRGASAWDYPEVVERWSCGKSVTV
jgi:hypothetical protein